MATINLLWADDDCEGLLSALEDIFLEEDLLPCKAINYSNAMNHLNNEQNNFLSALLDVILPKDVGAYNSELGLSLGEEIAKRGIKRIVFLSVVRYESIKQKFDRLKTDYPEVRFYYVDKTTLLEPNVINKIISFLKHE